VFFDEISGHDGGGFAFFCNGEQQLFLPLIK
jgi:hypothetical protein